MAAIEILLMLALSANAHDTCEQADFRSGACLIRDGAVIRVTETTNEDDDEPPPRQPPPGARADMPEHLWDDYEDCVARRATNRNVTCEFYWVTGPVTASDIATFLAAAPVMTIDPDELTWTGYPTEFALAAATHEVPGELLGQPAVVRFTPIGSAWSFGDGEWAEPNAMRVEHVYRKRGIATVEGEVRYTAEYRYDGPDWLPVRGEVRVGALQSLPVRSAKTVLTRGTCIEFPHDPGCPDGPPLEPLPPMDPEPDTRHR